MMTLSDWLSTLSAACTDSLWMALYTVGSITCHGLTCSLHCRQHMLIVWLAVITVCQRRKLRNARYSDQKCEHQWNHPVGRTLLYRTPIYFVFTPDFVFFWYLNTGNCFSAFSQVCSAYKMNLLKDNAYPTGMLKPGLKLCGTESK